MQHAPCMGGETQGPKGQSRQTSLWENNRKDCQRTEEEEEDQVRHWSSRTSGLQENPTTKKSSTCPSNLAIIETRGSIGESTWDNGALWKQSNETWNCRLTFLGCKDESQEQVDLPCCQSTKGWRDRTQQTTSLCIPFWDHSACHIINQKFAARNLTEPFEFIMPIQENNGRLASKYFREQEVRNITWGQDKKTFASAVNAQVLHLH